MTKNDIQIDNALKEYQKNFPQTMAALNKEPQIMIRLQEQVNMAV